MAYPNVLLLRLRMPISDDLHPRSFLTKITKYKQVINIPNSVSVLYDLLPLLVSMAERSITGIVNFTNPGTISHNECLGLYREIVDPSFHWQNFSVEEQAKVLKAGRSNNELDCTKLLKLNPTAKIPTATTAVRQALERMAGKCRPPV
jgi:3,5-epimerase/4-reductase